MSSVYAVYLKEVKENWHNQLMAYKKVSFMELYESVSRTIISKFQIEAQLEREKKDRQERWPPGAVNFEDQPYPSENALNEVNYLINKVANMDIYIKVE